MNTRVLLKVFLTPATGWMDAINTQSSATKILFLLVVPSMLLPPVMLIHAGEHYQNVLPVLSNKSWELYVPFLFLLEAITFAVLIFQIKNIASSYGATIGYREAFLLASLSIIPLCLSFLTFIVPSIRFIFGFILGSFCYSCFILYKGFCAFNNSQEELLSAHIAYTVICAAGSWVVLLALLIAIR